MSIIAETILGILFLAAVACLAAWFLFREQFHRLLKYLRLWQEEDARREKREERLRENLKAQEHEQEMRDAAARERAEAEVEDIGGKSHL